MASIILALGSNIGKKLDNLSQAINLITTFIGQIKKISSVYRSSALLQKKSPLLWNTDYYNLVIEINSILSPCRILNKIRSIEIYLGRKSSSSIRWAPRIIDIDIISYGTFKIKCKNLILPHKDLLFRNFFLKPLIEICPNWFYPNININLHQKLKNMKKIYPIPHTIYGSKIMGVVNLSSNSKSFKKKIFNHQIFEKKILNLIRKGVSIIDIGAESTDPKNNSQPFINTCEILRYHLLTLDKLLKNIDLPFKIDVCIDTYHEKIIKEFIHINCISIVNDVYGINSSKIINIVKNKDIKYIFTQQYGKSGVKSIPISNIIEYVIQYALKQKRILINLGIKKENIIFDLGIGFSKQSFQIWHLLLNVNYIKEKVKMPVMISSSRKPSSFSYLYTLIQSQQDIMCSILSNKLYKDNIDYLRFHNIELNSISRFL